MRRPATPGKVPSEDDLNARERLDRLAELIVNDVHVCHVRHGVSLRHQNLLNFTSNILNNNIVVLGNSRLSLVGWQSSHAVTGNPVMAFSLFQLFLGSTFPFFDFSFLFKGKVKRFVCFQPPTLDEHCST